MCNNKMKGSAFVLYLYFSIAFATLVVTYTQAAPSSNKKFQIDDFIDQLMTSQKFDQLTDLIAEKAVNKITNITKDVSILRNGDNETDSDKKSSEVEKSSSEDKKSFDDDKNVSNDVKKPVKPIKRNDDKPKFGQIDMDSFLKDDAPSKDLHLNFKQLKEELIKTKNNLKHEKKAIKDQIISDDDSNTKNDATLEIKAESLHTKDDDDDISEGNEKYTEHENDVIKNVTNSSSKTKKGGDTIKKKKDLKLKSRLVEKVLEKKGQSSEKSEYQSDAVSNENAEKESESLDENNVEDATQITDVVTRLNENRDDATDFSKEVVEVALKTDNEDTTENKSELHDEKKEIDQKNQKTKSGKKSRVIRRENGKLYTYVSAPEYADYHDQLYDNQNIF